MTDDPAVEAACDAILRWRRELEGDKTSANAVTGVDAYHRSLIAAIVAAVRPVLAREAFTQAADAIEAAPKGSYVYSTYQCVHPVRCPWGSYGETKPHTEHEQGIWTETDYAALVRGLGGEQ